MLTVSRQNSSCQEGWTICNGRGLIHHLLYPTTLYLFYLKVLFINQFCFYWRGNLSFFIMCHYTTPIAAITVLIRPQVYPQTQTLEQTDTGACAHAGTRTRLQLWRLAVLCWLHLTCVTWADSDAGEEGEVEAGGLTMRGRERAVRGGGWWSMKSLELRKTFSCLVISWEYLNHLPELRRSWGWKGETKEGKKQRLLKEDKAGDSQEVVFWIKD